MYTKKDFIAKRAKFNKYPIYLQETLFYNEKKLQDLRKLEISQRFFICDEWRETGNRHFHKGHYARALNFYTLVEL